MRIVVLSIADTHTGFSSLAYLKPGWLGGFSVVA
jgi:hypothetical protein